MYLKWYVLKFKCTCVAGDTNDLDACFGIKSERQLNGSPVYLPYYHGDTYVDRKFLLVMQLVVKRFSIWDYLHVNVELCIWVAIAKSWIIWYLLSICVFSQFHTIYIMHMNYTVFYFPPSNPRKLAFLLLGKLYHFPLTNISASITYFKSNKLRPCYK